jgi:membrane protease YdiL (CAAX protease family)
MDNLYTPEEQNEINPLKALKTDIRKAIITVLCYLVFLTGTAIVYYLFTGNSSNLDLIATTIVLPIFLIFNHQFFTKKYEERLPFQRQHVMSHKTFFLVLFACLMVSIMSGYLDTYIEWILNVFGLSMQTALVEASTETAFSFSSLLYGLVVAPVAEELLFRGIVARRLRKYGAFFSIVTSAVLFSLFHGNFAQFTHAFFIGLAFGLVACFISIKWSIFLHFINNLIVVIYSIKNPLVESGFLSALFVLGGLILYYSFRYLGSTMTHLIDELQREVTYSKHLKIFFLNFWFLIFLVANIASAFLSLEKL